MVNVIKNCRLARIKAEAKNDKFHLRYEVLKNKFVHKQGPLLYIKNFDHDAAMTTEFIMDKLS